ncbi:MAG: RidA family protein [Proteobacteria bacterium]|nr:RidA family protein [Pseudomonadota bacterium]
MNGEIDQRLEELDIVLPKPPKPIASYVPFTTSGKLIFISGQVPLGAEGLMYRGKIGGDLTLEDGQQAARLCALNILAQVQTALDGDLDRVTQIIRLGGFVNATDDFTDQPLVINGASDLMVEIFGDSGRHARTAVGTNTLPVGVSVEIDAIVEFS